MALAFPSSDFWDFSVTLYGKPGVAAACLALQDRHGVDVNILMFCFWLAASGRGPVGRRSLDEAFAAAEAWHAEIVRNLRALRKRLKQPVGPADAALAQALRARIQKIEIDAEHIEQLTLAASAAAEAPARPGLGAGETAVHGADHVACYFRHLGAKPDAAGLEELCDILAAAFALPANALRAHLERAFA
ncbi:MAG: TIGR02444 family protein [Alphaproteobacteria bacterium]